MTNFDNYNEADLRRLVQSQKSRITHLLNDVSEARDIAKQLLFELRQHTETPATHASYWWLAEQIDGGSATEEQRGM